MIINLSHHPMTVKDPHPKAWPNKRQVIPQGYWMDSQGNVRPMSPPQEQFWFLMNTLQITNRDLDQAVLDPINVRLLP